MLEDGLDLLALDRLIDLLAYVKAYLPGVVRDVEDLALLLHISCESLEKIVWLKVGEEGVSAALSLDIVLNS